MIKVEKIDTDSKAQIRRFVRLPFRLYEKDAHWVPPVLIDNEAQLDKKNFPFYEHSEADFFVAVRDGQDVGRVAAIHNRRFNQHHATHKAQFYFLESVDDAEVMQRLFERVFEWAQARQLDTVIGPKGLGPLDGFGLLVDGFDTRQMMTMMNYNQPHLPRLLEGLGFTKEVDFVSCFADSATFVFPDKVHEISARVQQRGTLRVQNFHTIRELKTWAGRIGEAYNKAFVNNWEYYPLTEREIAFVVKNLETIADPELIKIIVHDQDVVGFLFAFPDVAAALQRSGGKLLPFGLVDMLIEMRRTEWVAVNAAGVLPEYQGRGGNALLYTEMEKTVRQRNFKHAALYQVAETAVNMRHDLETVGGIKYKNHRVYTRKV
jgi:GNAT superfamily N-acetyltransferase